MLAATPATLVLMMIVLADGLYDLKSTTRFSAESTSQAERETSEGYLSSNVIVYSPVPVLTTDLIPLIATVPTAAEAERGILPARRTGFLKNE